MSTKINKRYIGALILAPFLIFLFLGGVWLKYALMILSIFGMYEFYHASSKNNINPYVYLGYIFCIIYYVFLNNFTNANLFMTYISIFAFISLCMPVLKEKYNFIDSAITILGFIYVSVFFSFISLINYKSNGKYLIWLVFISSWLCDTTAYYVGKYFGKNKLNPRVSPKKTIEGSIGGLFGSTIACFLYGLYLNNIGIHIGIYHFIIIGVLCGVFCQFGDLVASSIKRFVGIKDYSNLIPGHGGILDRFDSILFSAVVVYCYLNLIVFL